MSQVYCIVLLKAKQAVKESNVEFGMFLLVQYSMMQTVHKDEWATVPWWPAIDY